MINFQNSIQDCPSPDSSHPAVPFFQSMRGTLLPDNQRLEDSEIALLLNYYKWKALCFYAKDAGPECNPPFDILMHKAALMLSYFPLPVGIIILLFTELPRVTKLINH